MVSILGSHLTGPTQATTFDPTASFPTSVAGTIVTFNGIAAPLLYISPTPDQRNRPFRLGGTNQRAGRSATPKPNDTYLPPYRCRAPHLEYLPPRRPAPDTEHSSSRAQTAHSATTVPAIPRRREPGSRSSLQAWECGPPLRTATFSSSGKPHDTTGLSHNRGAAGEDPVRRNAGLRFVIVERAAGERGRAGRAYVRTPAGSSENRCQRQLPTERHGLGSITSSRSFTQVTLLNAGAPER